MLVDEGKLRWDDRVIDHMPGFQMYDPYVTREMTVRDLLVHRSGLGLGAGDLMFLPPSDLTREEIIRRIRFLKPATSFRSRYAYDNLLYLVAGQLIPRGHRQELGRFREGAHLRSARDDLHLHRRRALKAGTDVAIRTRRSMARWWPCHRRTWTTTRRRAPSTRASSDLAKWLIVQARSRRAAQGDRLFSEAQSKEMWSAQTILPIEDLPAGAPAALAPAAQLQRLRPGLDAARLSRHANGVLTRARWPVTFRASLWCPELKLGVVVLTNQEETGAHTAIAWTVLDHYLGAPPTDWVAAFRGCRRSGASARPRRRSKSGRTRATRIRGPRCRWPAMPAAIATPGTATCVIEERGGKLAISFTHTPAAGRRPGALAVRHLRGALAQPHPGRGRLRHFSL